MICLPKSVFGCLFKNTLKSISSLAFPQHPPVFCVSYALVPKPAPPPPCMLKYSVKEGRRGGSGGEACEVGRGGMGGGGGGSIDVRSAAVVMIFCSLFLGTSCPLRVTSSSTVFTGSDWMEKSSVKLGCESPRKELFP